MSLANESILLLSNYEELRRNEILNDLKNSLIRLDDIYLNSIEAKELAKSREWLFDILKSFDDKKLKWWEMSHINILTRTINRVCSLVEGENSNG